VKENLCFNFGQFKTFTFYLHRFLYHNSGVNVFVSERYTPTGTMPSPYVISSV